MSRKNVEDIYPLSPMQQGMLFQTLYAEEPGVYVVTHAFTLEGPLDAAAFQRALQDVVDRHAVLRTAFLWERREAPLQVVREKVKVPLTVDDLRALSAEEQVERLRRHRDDDRRRGFDLTRPPLLRAALFRLGDTRHRLLLSLHHILLDGWSLPIVLDELFRLHAAHREGRALRLDRPRAYGEYIAWLGKQDKDRLAAFWKARLRGLSEPTPLGVDRPLSASAGLARFGELRRALSDDVSTRIAAFSRRHPITAGTLFHGAYALLLSRYSGEDDVLFGATVSGRAAPIPGIESMVGLFINTVPSRVTIDPDARVLDWLTALQARLNELRDVEHGALVDVQGQSEIPRGQPLFESLLVFENFPFDGSSWDRPGGLRVIEQSTIEHTDIPLTVVGALRDRVHLKLGYDLRRFDAAAIERMMGHLEALLLRLAERPDRRLGEISILVDEERHRLLVEHNATDAPLPDPALVHALVEEQAEATPDAIAVRCEGQAISYGSLRARAHRLAHLLRAEGVAPEVLVGVLLRRTPALVEALLAVLAAGGAYVPLDPDLPPDRLSFFLDDAAPPVLLTEEALLDRLPPTGARVICLDRDRAMIDEQPSSRPASGVMRHHPAYVIYTSGSTGRPKGVVLLHEGVVNYLTFARSSYRAHEGTGAPVHSSIGFDLTVTSLFVPLVSGKTVTLIPESRGVTGLSAALQGNPSFSLVKLTPAHLDLLAQSLPPGDAAGATGAFVIGGEALFAEHLAFFNAHAPETRLINEYGPTETVVGCCVHEVPAGELARGPVPIGRPVANTRLYVLDARREPVPIGVAGELYIGGVQVGRGYLHRPDLTAERFLPDPFSARPDARLYRTGDRVRRLENGDLVFLGRSDLQVKIRGYRIELGEIEAVLARCPGVREVAVTVRHDAPGTPRLVAYLVIGEGFAGADEIRSLARRELPEVMVPSVLVVLPALPLTAHGKVDRKALPAPGESAWATAAIEPRGPVEQAIATIFAEVLRVPPASVGAESSFFDLGGHSLLATAALSRISSAFAINLPLRALFDAPTPASLAARVEAALRGGATPERSPITPGSIEGERPLSFAEERLWFLSQLAPDDPSYVVSLAFRLRGPLDVPALSSALREISARQAILRTTFPSRDGRAIAIVAAEPSGTLPLVSLEELDPSSRAAEIERRASLESRTPIDIARGPLLRTTLLRFDESDHALLLSLHHIASDAWTIGLLQREIGALYAALSAGRPSPLPPLPVQVSDVARWQRLSTSDEASQRALAYWTDHLEGVGLVLDLPGDQPRPAEPSHRGGRTSFVLSKPVSRALVDLSRREGATLFMTLLGAFVTLLHRLSGQTDFTVGTPIANRSRPEIEGLFGLFIDTLVLRARPSPEQSFRELLAQIKATCLGAYAHQDLPFERLVEALAVERDLGHSPLFQVMFTVERHGSPALELPGLHVERVTVRAETAKHELSLAFVEEEQGLAGLVEYSRDRFEPATIDRWIAELCTLLEGIVKAPDQRLGRLPLLPEPERQTLLAWNATEAAYPEGRTFIDLFEAEAEKTPEALALVFGDQEITYRALAERSRRLGRLLRKRGVGPESRVGLSLPRSPSLIASVLGIWQAGGAYVPLDPGYPEERLSFMMADAELSLLVSDRETAARLPRSAAQVLCLDEVQASLDAESAAPLDIVSTADSAAYVIYTSGSTGQPKGVVVEHRGLGNVGEVHRRSFGAGPGERALQFSSINFDASVWELCMGLLTGGALVLADKESLLPGPGLLSLLRSQRVTMWTVPPSVLGALPFEELPDLRTIVVAGEACPEELVNRWAPGRHFWNAYGPTETTICATMGECRAGEGKPSIGKPIANMHVVVLDGQNDLAPIGVPGELCIGGVGLARGYLKREELTAARFIVSPLGGRLYRSGDRARWRADGTLEYLGRLDEQVKLRGFRIELGEIEEALRRQPGIEDAVVMAREARSGERALVAYVVGSAENAGAAGLDRALRKILPDAMVPSLFVRLPALPLLPNGKVDRRALPAPADRVEERMSLGPRSPIEEAVTSIFAEVLRLPRVDAGESFFAIGGHSLLATQVMARIRSALGVDLPLRSLFESPAPADLARLVEAALRGEPRLVAPPIVPVPRAGDLPLSFAQERLWFLNRLEPEDTSYVVPIALRIGGRLDEDALGRALAALARRHEVLRTTFASRDGRPIQVIHEDRYPTLGIEDLGKLADPEAAMRARAAAERGHPFDLERGPLLRATLLRLSPDDRVLLLTMHHIVSDAWSNGILVGELFTLYGAEVEGRPSPLPDLPVQHADHAAWQRRWLDGEVLARELDHWKTALRGAPEALDLPSDRPRPKVPSRRGAWASALVSPEVARGLEALSRRSGTTLYMTLLAAFYVLLQRWTGQRDLVVGTPIANRTHTETERLIGFFINTLVLRTQVDDDLTIAELLGRVRETCLAAYAHQDLPFERLVQELAPERDRSRTPLFSVMFGLQNTPRDIPAPQGLSLAWVGAPGTASKFDITLGMAQGPEGLLASIEYAEDLFDRPTIERMLAHFFNVLAAFASGEAKTLGDVSILSAAERQTLLVDWNRTAADYPRGETFPALFEAQVDRDPSAPALLFGDETWSYGRLDEHANRLAHHLRRFGVGPEVRVGISMRRRPEVVVSLLAVMKAGGAYVPIDPNYPRDRIELILEDAGIAVLLTEEQVLDELPALLMPAITLDSGWPSVAAEPADRLASRGGVERAAYVIYTSGSTGRPKGVVVEHRGLGNVAEVHRRAFGVGPGSRVLQFSSISFDASVWEMCMALLNGAALVIAPEEQMLPGPDLVRLLRAQGVTHLTAPPSALSVMPDDEIPSLGTLIVAGEACRAAIVDRWAPGRRFFNAYGPTEATICASMTECRAGEGSPSIGRPIANVTIVLLDEALRLVPVGVPGELYIGGVGLARGYLNQPDLTRERFVQSPFDPGERLYRTGDLCRYRLDGNIDFLGRVDEQVKIRGYRVELGEIEAVLAGHPDIAEAAVAARDDASGTKTLVAYFVAAGGAPEIASLRAFLAERLPEHMLPSAYVPLLALPIGPTGKVDRKALPAPEARAGLGVTVAPRDPIEDLLVGIWEDVLEIPEVGIFDDFFDLGGHSLLATQVMGRIAAVLGVEIPLQALFEAPTVAGLAERAGLALRAPGSAPVPSIEPALPGTMRVASFAQERLWFLAQLEPDSASYVVPILARYHGKLDIAALERALAEVIARHEVLRTTFSLDGEHLRLHVHEAAPIALPVTSLLDLDPGEREHAALREVAIEASRPIDLGAGPLLRGRIFILGEDEHALLLVLHHIVADAWAIGVLNRELGLTYASFAAGLPSPLPALSIQYADYAAFQRRLLTGEVLAAELAYFRDALGDAPVALDLPTDRPRPAVPTHRGARRPIAFSPALSRALVTLSREQGVTLFMTLLAALGVLLHRLTGQRDLLVGTPIANRSRAETEALIGFFLNTLVLRLKPSPEQAFSALLAEVKKTALGAYAHQEVPFERLVQELSPGRDLSRAPLFQVLFSLQNAPGEALELPGLDRRSWGVENTTSKFDLSILLAEGDQGIFGSVIYSLDLFDAATIDRWIGHLQILLEALAADPSLPVGDLPLLSGEERRRILVAWNDTDFSFQTDLFAHQLFEREARRAPDAIALLFEDRTLTYRALDAMSRRLAARLAALGAGPDRLVGVCLPRSLDMVVAVLAVLRAGAAYVPLDPEYPRERLGFMIEDAAVPVLVTWTEIAERLPPHKAEVIILDLDAMAIDDEPAPPLETANLAPDHLAYVVYTSGSTGAPKGAMNTQGALRNRLLSMQEAFPLSPSDRLLHKTPFSFDVSVWELLWPLTAGASLVIASPALHRDAGYLARIIAERGVTALHFVPSMLRVFLDEPAARDCRSLRLVFSGGEALTPDLCDRFFDVIEGAALHNLYGPAEAAIDVTTWPCRRGAATIPIGRPFHNVRAYILDERGAPVPVGVRGELYLGGVQVGRGYLGRPALSAERFLPDPFSGASTGKLYRTGDHCRFSPSGDIEYLGRADQQVKLRGVRIELGEIEAVLRRVPGVHDAAAMVREDSPGERRLVAYLVSDAAPAAAELRALLGAHLPEPMIPAAFVALPALPLSPNGKVDRAALPAPAASAPRDDLTAPRTPVEEAIAGLFAELLGLAEVSVHDDFFACGGHSLLATRLVARLRALFQIDLPLLKIFERPTVEGLGAEVEAALRGGTATAEPLIRLDRSAPLEPSFAQERLWFLNELSPGDTTYLLPSAVRIRGPLDPMTLHRALAAVARRHEILRAHFPMIDGRPRLVVRGDPELAMPVVDLGPISAAEREARVAEETATEARRPFDLAAGPLVRARLLRFGNEDSLLLLTMHHIVSDAWSRGIFDRELWLGYRALSRGEPPPLADLPIQVADHAAWQRRLLAGPEGARLLSYWTEQLRGAPGTLDLPTDRPRAARVSSQGGQRALALPKALGRSLEALARTEGVTPFMVGLAAFSAFLHRITAERDLVIGTPIDNRSRAELLPLIGFFVNTLALRVRPSPALSFRALLGQVKQTCLGAYAHQELPFERLVSELSPERDLAHSPLFSVMFLHQRPGGQAPSVPGLDLHPVSIAGTVAKLDLTLALIEGRDGLSIAIEYRSELFDPATIDRMLERFAVLLQGIIHSPGAPLADLPLLPAPERRTLLAWNAMEAAYPEGRTFIELFEAQAEKTPEALAIAFGDQEITYRALAEQSRRLGRLLRKRGVGPESRVGLSLPRSPSLIASVLGIWQAGGAYVPLDPGYPEERLSFMMADAELSLLVSDRETAARLPRSAAQVLCLDEVQASLDAESAAPLDIVSTADSAAYVIYTSGSTGRPKGVVVEHRGLGNVAEVHRRSFGAGPGERALQFSSINFDASVWELCMGLLTGGALVLADKESLLPGPGLLSLLRSQRVTMWTVPPSVLGALPFEELPDLRTIVVAGEACPEELVNRWAPGRHFWNAYGPTETTICATMGECRAGEGKPSIGKPIANMHVVVLDGQNDLAPIGVPGELCIGGGARAWISSRRSRLRRASS
ncbi:MAG: non-ribosomal peptide synthase/polyketide synthase [Byssovorax sp.]